MFAVLFLMVSFGTYATNASGLLGMGYQAEKQGNYSEAFKYYTQSAKLGDAQAQANLGVLYFFGKGTNTNYKKSLFWLEKAKVKNNSSAYNNLAYMYVTGKGVKQNIPQAVLYYKKAASLNEVGSQRRLGTIYFDGQVVPQNLEQAYLYFSLAARSNDSVAASMLSVVTKQMTSQQLKQANDLVASYKLASTD
tara:strand:+ start:7041 stop:7619 length:579 start_codon:yes stop_codon:yes gene_type:complete